MEDTSNLHIVLRVEHRHHCPVAERWSDDTRTENLGPGHRYHGPTYATENLPHIDAYAACHRHPPFGDRGPLPGRDVPGAMLTPEWWAGFSRSQAGSWWAPGFVTDATLTDWTRFYEDGWRVSQYLVPSEHTRFLRHQILFRPPFATFMDEFPVQDVAAPDTDDIKIYDELKRLLRNGSEAA